MKSFDFTNSANPILKLRTCAFALQKSQICCSTTEKSEVL